MPKGSVIFEEATAINKVCESSGREKSPKSLMDLCDLVNSFLERRKRG